MNTITRAHLATAVNQEVGYSQIEAAQIIEAVFNKIIETLANGEEVKISSFGSFYPKQKKERLGRNPKTKQEAVITPRNVVSFYASNMLKEQINKD